MSVSIEFGVNVEGVEQIQDTFDRLRDLMNAAVHRSLDSVGADIHMAAFRMCPVRSGFLRSTIYYVVEDWLLKVGARAPYALFVEFGTRYVGPRYFLTEAFQLNWPRLGQVLAWTWDAALQSITSGGE